MDHMSQAGTRMKQQESDSGALSDIDGLRMGGYSMAGVPPGGDSPKSGAGVRSTHDFVEAVDEKNRQLH
jgi:hypothetical protein